MTTNDNQRLTAEFGFASLDILRDILAEIYAATDDMDVDKIRIYVAEALDEVEKARTAFENGLSGNGVCHEKN